MSERPLWTRKLITFVSDTVIDSEWGYADEHDPVSDEIENAVRAILCREYGHEIEDDHCGIPSHRYCLWCDRGIIDINHTSHAGLCSCLNDSDICCVDSCPCPRVSHGRS